METHSSILAWKIPWTEEPGTRVAVHRVLKSETQLNPLSLSSVTQSCPTLQPQELGHPNFLVHHQVPELAQTHVHQVGDDIQPSHALLFPSPPAFNLS